MSTLIIPKLALREATSLANRKKLSPEAFDVLDKLAHRSGVVITSVTLMVRTKEGMFALPMAPDTAHEVLTALTRMSPQENDNE